MTTEKQTGSSPILKWDGAISFGTVIHIAVLLIGLTAGWFAFDKRLSMIERDHEELIRHVSNINKRTDRLDRYMVAHDKDYANVPVTEDDTK